MFETMDEPKIRQKGAEGGMLWLYDASLQLRGKISGFIWLQLVPYCLADLQAKLVSRWNQAENLAIASLNGTEAEQVLSRVICQLCLGTDESTSTRKCGCLCDNGPTIINAWRSKE